MKANSPASDALKAAKIQAGQLAKCSTCRHYLAPDKGESMWHGVCLLLGLTEAHVKRGHVFKDKGVAVSGQDGVVICGTGYLTVGPDFGCRYHADRLPDQSAESSKVKSLRSENRLLKKVRATAMMQGYVQAVAEIVRLHDEPSLAKDVLRSLGKVDWRLIDEFDLETLVKAGLAAKPRRKNAVKNG